MITYLYIDGFKAFKDFEIYLTPVTVVAGTNASGKSNLFDALSFLSCLASGRSLSEVMNGKRGEGDELFTQYHDGSRAREMKFKIEMLLNRDYHDEFKQKGRLGVNRLRYELTVRRNEELIGERRFSITSEMLRPILRKDDVWMESLPQKTQDNLLPENRSRQQTPFIQTKTVDGSLIGEVVVEYSGKTGTKGKNQLIKKSVNFDEAQHTLISRYQDTDYLHIIAARQEMSRWMFMHLSPEIMRMPSSKSNRAFWLMPNGGNLATALYMLKQNDNYLLRVLERRLNQLLPTFIGIDITDDKENNQYVLRLEDVNGRWYSSRVLSEGTLRILTLCVMLLDESHRGVLCFEEPENGVHPQRINDIAQVVTELGSCLSEEGPLRQVIVNTHSPIFVRSVGQCGNRWVSVYLSRMVASVITAEEGRRVKLYRTSMTPTPITSAKNLKEYSLQETRLTAHEIADYLQVAQKTAPVKPNTKAGL